MFERRKLKARSREILKTAYLPILVAVIIQFFSSNIITAVLSSCISMVSLIPGVASYTPHILRFVLSTLLSVFIYGPLIVGTTKIILDVSRFKNADYIKVFEPFKKEHYLKTVRAMSVRMIISQLLAAQMNVVLRLYLFIATNNRLPEIPSEIPSYAITASVVIFIALSIFLTVKCFDYFLIEFIVADDYDIGLIKALNTTKNYMKGNKFAALILGLSMTGWFFLGALMCGIGYILVLPYLQEVITQLYFELKGEPGIASGKDDSVYI